MIIETILLLMALGPGTPVFPDQVYTPGPKLSTIATLNKNTVEVYLDISNLIDPNQCVIIKVNESDNGVTFRNLTGFKKCGVFKPVDRFGQPATLSYVQVQRSSAAVNRVQVVMLISGSQPLQTSVTVQ